MPLRTKQSKKPLLLLTWLGIAVALSQVVPQHAFAGDHLSTEPFVHATRERFRQARTPRLEDLAIGQSWDCEIHTAQSDSNRGGQFQHVYVFQRDPSGDIQSATVDSPTFAISSLGMRGNNFLDDELRTTDYFRVSSDGNLIVERTLPTCSGVECFFPLVAARSVSNEWAAVVSYRECWIHR